MAAINETSKNNKATNINNGNRIPTPEIIIDVRNLNKSFAGKPAVINVSLQVKKGAIFGFLGPNGSGKTTTIRMLCGLLKPDSGEGQCLGYDVINDSIHIKPHVGYMTQKFSLYQDLTVRENLDFVARLYKMKNRQQAIAETIAELNLSEYADQLAGTLSGGWKQRLALAAALVHHPQLLLLDEPTAGVDPKARRDFWDYIYRLTQAGMTALVSTHYMDEAERCTQLAYISYGQILAQETGQEIIAQSGLAIWQVTGPNLEELSEQLRELPGVEQVGFVRDVLHVGSTDSQKLQENIVGFQKYPYEWQQVSPNLEEVFIALMTKSGSRGRS